MIALHHAKPAVTASSRSGVRVVNVPRCRKYGLLGAYLRHRSDYAAGAPGFGVSRRVVDRFGYRIASMIALLHAKTPVAASGRTGVCRGVVNKVSAPPVS